jgi:hypothetical protein
MYHIITLKFHRAARVRSLLVVLICNFEINPNTLQTLSADHVTSSLRNVKIKAYGEGLDNVKSAGEKHIL